MRETIIKAQKNWSLSDLGEIWHYRELLYIFIWRDIKVRYKQTLLGILWVIFQPLITTVVFTFFFGRVAKIPSGDLPYSLFTLCGLVYWTFFSSSLSHASDSMIANESIIKKIYFPKITLAISSVLTSFVDFTINFVLLLIYAAFLGFFPNLIIFIILPLGVFLTLLTTSGLGLLLSSLNVKYRDVRYIIPFFIQILLFVTPVIYPLAIVSERNRLIMALNPMTSVVELTRYIFSDKYQLNPQLLLISIISSLTILAVGLWYFRKTEQFFADIV